MDNQMMFSQLSEMCWGMAIGVCSGTNTRTENKANGKALIAMKSRLRPNRDLLVSDHVAIKGFVMASKPRASILISQITVNIPRIKPGKTSPGNITLPLVSGGMKKYTTRLPTPKDANDQPSCPNANMIFRHNGKLGNSGVFSRLSLMIPPQPTLKL